MNVQNLRPYLPNRDVPRTGWDELAILDAQAAGTALYVDENGNVWTDGLSEHIGQIRKEENNWRNNS